MLRTRWVHRVNLHLSEPVPSNDDWKQVVPMEDFLAHRESANIRERRYMDIENENMSLKVENQQLKMQLERINEAGKKTN